MKARNFPNLICSLVLAVILCCQWTRASLCAQESAAQATQPAASSTNAPAQSADASEPALAILAAAETAVQQAIERAAPSVVAIARFRRGAGARQDQVSGFDFNLPGIRRPLVNLAVNDVLPTEFGSGVIISEDGAILTCYHVIDDPEENDYYVWLSEQAVPGQVAPGIALPAQVVRVPAEVKAGDPWTDLAVLKIDAKNLPVMPMGDASNIRRGSFVVSLGNPYASARDGQASASWGLISNVQRSAPPARVDRSELNPAETLQEFGTLLQTDARLNLGTSGGALINIRGEMIGLTTSLAAVAGYEQAAGYAIPIDQPTLQTIAELKAGRAPAFGFLGVEPIDAGGTRGALVRRVVPGMAGDNAGLRSGDTIVAVDGKTIHDAGGLFREMSRRAADSEVTLTIFSGVGLGQRDLVARLGKKRLALARPGFSQIPEPTWRGMTVDFASALPPNRLMRGRLDDASEAAVVRVDPDSPAWKSGIRPGQLILQASGIKVQRPEEFYEAVEQLEGTVELTISTRFGSSSTVQVQPSTPIN